MANMNDELMGRADPVPKISAPKKAVYRAPKIGDQRGEDETLEIFTKRGWVDAIDPFSDYGGPYSDMCDLFADKRYQHDMMDLFGVPFQPSKVRRCDDPRYLRVWEEHDSQISMRERARRSARIASSSPSREYSRRRSPSREYSRRRSPPRNQSRRNK